MQRIRVGVVAIVAACAQTGGDTEPITVGAQPVAAGSTTFVDITPDNLGPYPGQPLAGILDCSAPCASGQNGGRVHNIAVVDANTLYAASEVGGLYKSVTGAASWVHLDGYLPATPWDVEVLPGTQRVIATAFSEGRVDTKTVLQLSTDAGATWTSKLPLLPPNCASERDKQASAFGIAVRPGTSEVLVGTSCGIARSTSSGDGWTAFDPTPADEALSVWDLVALPGGRTYACGEDGLLTSASGGPGTWTNLGKPSNWPGGFCSITVSPEETNVVFVIFGNPTWFGDLLGASNGKLYQAVVVSSASGSTATWTELKNPDDPIGTVKARLPFVVTNPRSAGYDVWAGISSLVRGTCTTPPAATLPAPSVVRCPTWSDTFNDKNGQLPQKAHGDSGDLVFDPTASVDACPWLYSSDGGIYKNTLTGSSCHDPDFTGVNSGLHAFLLWDMQAVHFAGEDDEDLYFGTQDNGTYYTSNAGAAAPTWQHVIGADSYDLAADGTTVVHSAGTDLTAGDRGFLNMNTNGTVGLMVPLQDIPDTVVRAGPGRYLFAMTSQVSYGGSLHPASVRDVTNVKASPFGVPFGNWVDWSKGPCHLAVGASPTGPQPYALSGRCDWADTGARSAFGAGRLSVCRAACQAGGNWEAIATPPLVAGGTVPAGAGFGLIAVDPSDANRIYAEVLRDGPPRMMRSTDGGVSWTWDAELTWAIRAGFLSDLPGADRIHPFLQPLMVTFDPDDPHLIVAGGNASGVFLSSDGGESWSLLTDPETPAISGIPHLTRPLFAHFDHDKAGMVRVYLGTGRGIWRVGLANADVAVGVVDAPKPVSAGTDLTYTIQVTNNGPDNARDVRWRETMPVGTTFKSLATPAGWTCKTPPVGGIAPLEIRCETATMSPGSASFTLVVHVGPSVANGSSIASTVRVHAASVDADLSNNLATTTTAVIARTDLRISQTDSADPAYAGESLTYTITVVNDGPSDATGVVVTDTLPSAVEYSSNTGGCVESPAHVLTCAVGALAAGAASVSFTVTVQLPADIVYANGGPLQLSNIASVSGAQVDPDASDNSDTETTSVAGKSDVAITSFAPVSPPAEVIVGKPVSVVLRKVITNHGPSAPVDVTLSRHATAPAGSQVTPVNANATASALTKEEVRTVDELFTITCNVPGTQVFTFSNTIALAKSSDIDPVPGNNSASTTVSVGCVVPVAINIQPGGFPNGINLNGDATVAVLSTAAGEYNLPLAFYAPTIQPLTVRFGPPLLVFTGAGGASEIHGTVHLEYSRELDEKTRDRDLDGVLHFKVAASGLTVGAKQACVKGTFIAGGTTYKFFGCDSVKVSP